MADASLRFVIVVVVSSLMGHIVTMDAADTYTGLVSRICNGEIYSLGDDNFNAPGAITDLIAKDIPNDPNYDDYRNVISAESYLYGHGACSGSLNRNQCATCMNSARDQLFSECSWHGVGAQIELQGCRLRYEKYYFGPSK